MAHEITATDGLVLHRMAAWHGLGTIVSDAPTPLEALPLAKLEWEALVNRVYLPGAKRPVDRFRIVTRSDTGEELGAVGKDWTAIQNREVAQFCMDLAEQGDTVRCESAGSIRGGRRIWFLLKGESFSVRGKDEVAPYICVSNGHDGYTAMRAIPTTVRVVCSNTLHMVIPEGRTSGGYTRRLSRAGFVCHHTKGVAGRVEEAKAALKLYHKALTDTREVIDELAMKDANSEKFKQFFLKCYTRDVGAIPTNPGTKAETNAAQRAQDAWLAVERRFEEEWALTGGSMWGVMQAYTGWYQNDRPSRLKDPVKIADSRAQAHLFGTAAVAAHNSLGTALAMAG